MDLSIQKMQPPASLKGKTAAKRTNQGDSDEAVETVAQDEAVRFTHGNTAYESSDPEEQPSPNSQTEERQSRRKQRQLLSRDDLSQLTMSVEHGATQAQTAEGLMHLRAYKTQSSEEEDKKSPNFEVNI